MTAPVYSSKNIFDNGLAYLKTKCNAVILTDYAYVAGDSYAAVRGVADVNIVAEKTGIVSTDIVLADQGTIGRKATIPTLTITAAAKTSNGVAGGLKYIALDTVGTEVLAVWDCTSDQVVTIGNPVEIPPLIYNIGQPTG